MKKLICIILMLSLVQTNVFGKDNDEKKKYKQPYKLLGTVITIVGASMAGAGLGRMQSEVVDVYPDGTEIRNEVETNNKRNKGKQLLGAGCTVFIIGYVIKGYKVPTEKEFKGVVMKAGVGFNRVGLSFNF